MLQERHKRNHANQNIDHILSEKRAQVASVVNPEGAPCRPEIPAEIAPYLPNKTASDTPSDEAALLATLLTQTQAKTTALHTLEQTLLALNAIESLEKAALDIRVKTANAKVPDDAEAINLQTSVEAQQEAQCALREQIQLCQTCHESLLQLKIDVAVIKEQETLLANQSKKKSQAARQAPQTSHEVAHIQTTITDLVIDFKEKATRENQRIQPVNMATQALQTALTDWDILINRHLSPHTVSAEITAWYHTLFKQLQDHVSEEAPLLQAIQLLHAIHFELQHATKQADCVALKTYYTEYPSPQQSYLQLLQLKPALPLVEDQDHLLKVSNKKTQKKIDVLYQHQEKLQKKHPKAGMLLKQATITLHQFALAHEKSPSNTQASDLTFYLKDPYYRDLNNHRGFGKLREWLAEVCTAILNGLHITRNTDHRQRFFYSPTHSIQLLDATAPQLGKG